MQATLNDLAKKIPVDAPWTAAKADEWDRQTFETWLRANAVIPSAKFLFDVACTSIFSAEPRELSLLFVLFYIAAAATRPPPAPWNASPRPRTAPRNCASSAAPNWCPSNSPPPSGTGWC